MSAITKVHVCRQQAQQSTLFSNSHVTMIHVHVNVTLLCQHFSTYECARAWALFTATLHAAHPCSTPILAMVLGFWPARPVVNVNAGVSGPQHATGSSWRLRLRCAVIARTSCVKIQSVSQFHRAPPRAHSTTVSPDGCQDSRLTHSKPHERIFVMLTKYR